MAETMTTASLNVAAVSTAGSMPVDLSLLNFLQEQTSRLLGDSYNGVVQQTRRIQNQLDEWSSVANNDFEYLYLKSVLDSTTGPVSAALANASPQQFKILNDAVSMLSADYAYDPIQREIDLHRDCIAAAYTDLSSAAQIVMDGNVSNWQQMRQVQEYVLSAVQHLQDSCPLCRALKYAANDANQNLLPFVTVLCSSILKTLHPFVTDPSR